MLRCLVLYSASSKTWKVADFGLTAEATSNRAHATKDARGTQCYRAPELVQEYSHYNNKVDIFAMGCILFELATGGQKAFAGDIVVYQYSENRSKLEIPFDTTHKPSEVDLSRIIRAMLEIDGSRRPPASALKADFAQYRLTTAQDAWKAVTESNYSRPSFINLF